MADNQKNRKAAEAFLIEMIEEILPGGGNKEIYEKLFSQMSDEAFHKLMMSYASGEDRPVIYAPNFIKPRLNTERNLKIAEKLGHNFFERIWIHSDDPKQAPYLSNNPYMVIELPVRRQAQLLTKKISVPANNRSTDQLTGQPTGDSRASKISYNEVQIMRSMGLDNCLLELMKYRGGDVGGYNAMNKLISRDGATSMKAVAPYASGVESTQALKIFLTAAHLKTTL